MRRRLIYKVGFLIALVLGGMGADKFCRKQTGGFAICKIQSDLAFDPKWEVSQSEEILKALDQPFYYLGKGAQSFVFVSQDQQLVIKFFHFSHLRPPLWMFSSLPFPFQPYQVEKLLKKRMDLEKDFSSYKIAFEKMKEETGLLYLHLNKTHHLKQQLTIYDKIGIAHILDLDEMEFFVQKKATLVYPHIDRLVKTQGVDAAAQAIQALVQLLMHRCQKGIRDKDPDLNTNFGFIDGQPIQIDVGRFQEETQGKDLLVYQEEIMRITDNFRQWLDRCHPSLSSHLMQSIADL